jgi:hypothetical protein
MNRPALMLLLASFLAAACGGGSTTSGGPTSAPTGSGQTGAGGPSTTYDVTYTDGTSVIDSSAYEDALLAAPVPTDGDTSNSGAYHFKTADWVSALKPGQVVIFANHALVKVDSVDVAGGETTVQTEPATLDQAIQSGKLGWDYGVNWQTLPDASYQGVADALVAMVVPNGVVADSPLSRRAPAAAGAPGLSWSGTIEGFDTKLSLTADATRLNISLSAKKTTTGGAFAQVTAKGWISNFTQETFLTYEQSQASETTTKTIGLQGQIQVEWHAGAAPEVGAPLTDVTQFKIPVALPIPFTVGPIPVVLKLMATLQVVPELSVDKASSGGNYTIDFASDQGFSIKNELATPFSNVKSVNFAVTGETVSAGMGPVGFALGVEFPRFEISIFNTVSAFVSLKTYSTSQWTPGTTYTSDIPPCQMGTSQMGAYAGWNVKALGFKLAGDATELWKRDYQKYKDDKPCTLTGK